MIAKLDDGLGRADDVGEEQGQHRAARKDTVDDRTDAAPERPERYRGADTERPGDQVRPPAGERLNAALGGNIRDPEPGQEDGRHGTVDERAAEEQIDLIEAVAQ